MKENKILKEKVKLFEKEIETLIDQIDNIKATLKEFSDVKNEIKGLKIFIGRTHPEFKNKYPEILQKIYEKK